MTFNCQICGICIAETRVASLIVFEHHSNDHAAQFDLNEAAEKLLTDPDGAHIIRTAIIKTRAGCIVK